MEAQIPLLITEHKSVGTLRTDANARTVRVFINRDYQYGYWVPEGFLFRLLTPAQQEAYLAAPDQVTLSVPLSVAEQLQAVGLTPFKKHALAC